jgi:uncharacterized protein with beta-barrel porin domain
MYLYENDYQETGADSLDLSVQQKSSDLLRTEVGAQFSHCFALQEKAIKGTLVPDVKLSWIYETRFLGRKTMSSFVDNTCVFTVYGIRPTRNLVAPSVGITFYPADSGFSISGRYEAEFSKSFWEQGASFNLGYRF